MNEALDAMKFLAALLIDPRNSRVYGVRDIIIVSSLHLQHRRWYRTPDKKLDIRQPFIRKVISLHIVLQRVLASSINPELWLYMIRERRNAQQIEMQQKKIRYSQAE